LRSSELLESLAGVVIVEMYNSMSAETMVESPLVNFELLEPIPLVYGYTGIAVSVVFFQSLNQFLLRFGSPKSVRIDEMWKWRNLFVSWVHAVIVGTWDLSWLV